MAGDLKGMLRANILRASDGRCNRNYTHSNKAIWCAISLGIQSSPRHIPTTANARSLSSASSQYLRRLCKLSCNSNSSSSQSAPSLTSSILHSLRTTRISLPPTTRRNFSTGSWQSQEKSKDNNDKNGDTLPLSGITVLTLEQAIAGPFCTRQLADLGARVIKIERPITGDFARHYDDRVHGLASHFVWANRGKESLALDLKDQTDLDVVKTLLRKLNVDVLVQNLAPGASARLGLGWEALHAEFPRLIVCDISGYGQDGPYRDKKAYDLLIQSEAGLLSITGTEGESGGGGGGGGAGNGMAKVGISIADISAGMYAYSNVLAALMRRQKTGTGERIDVSMLECMVEWMGFPLYYAFEGQKPPGRAGASHAAIYPYGPFETGGGGEVMLGMQNEREWVKFCDIVLSEPELARDERFKSNKLRSDNRAELRSIICKRLSNLTVDETLALLDKADIANAKINDMQGVWNHAQLKARRRWTEVQTPNGAVPALLPPGVPVAAVATGGGQGIACMRPIPDVGEHNAAIFAELGIER